MVPAKLAPTLPPDINGDGVKSIAVPTGEYAYGLRVPRAGFIYLFYESGAMGANYWELYTVNQDGSMKRQPSATLAVMPQKDVACSNQGHIATRVHYLVIEKPEQCGTVWIAFSEHYWSVNTLNRYASNPDARKERMQAIEPNKWIDNPKPSDPKLSHATEATPATLGHVIEYRTGGAQLLCPPTVLDVSTNDRGDYSAARLEQQCSRYPAAARNQAQAVQVVKQMHVTGLRPTGGSHPPMMLALKDAVGITHELANYRNQAAGMVKKYGEERALQITAIRAIEGAQKALEDAAQERAETRQKLANDATKSARTGGGDALRKEAAKHNDPLRARYLGDFEPPRLLRRLPRLR